MHSSYKSIIVLLCLIHLGTMASAAAPGPAISRTAAVSSSGIKAADSLLSDLSQDGFLTTDTAPTEADSTEAAPTEAAPTEANPTEAAPTEAAPTEAVPTEAAPTEAAPTEAAPTEAAPTEANPTEANPTEAAPTEAAPTEANPTEANPTEAAPTEAAPANQEIPVSEMTDAQIIKKYSIKKNWARAGLIFAVRNGILAGRAKNKLCPTDNTNHAELATILINILKTEKQVSLKRFTDVKKRQWYVEPMSKTVSLGFFPIADPNATTLTPKTNITREEAFVVIARMFGIHGQGRQSIYGFSDWREVSDWAAGDLSALIDAGHLLGADGKLLPQQPITRQELAVILSRLLTQVCTALPDSSVTGNPALAAEEIPAGSLINGNLLFSTDATAITLENVTVTGRLILQGNDTLHLQLKDCSIGELVLCRPTQLYCDQTVSNVTSHAFLSLGCDATSVQCYDRLAIASGQRAEAVTAMQGAGITIDGTVTDLYITGDQVSVQGSGKIQTLHQYGAKLSNKCQTDSVVGTVRRTMDGVTATRIDESTVGLYSPIATFQLRLDHLPEGWSECDLIWYVNGEELTRTSQALCKEGTVISQECDLEAFMDGTRSTVKLSVELISGNVKKTVYSEDIQLNVTMEMLAGLICTQNVQGILSYNVTLYANMGLTGAIRSCPAGMQVSVLQSRQSSYTKIQLPDDTVGWVDFNAVEIIDRPYYTTDDYSTLVKEYYVNRVRNCSSKTNYLIWVSLYTQRVNIFTGYQGAWTLIHTGPISSGANYCPTPVEETTILYKTPEWCYSNYYCHHVSVFDEARGFHSRPTAYGGGIYSEDIGYPVSAGCVRLLDEDCTFIYDNCPVGTAVIIY